MASDTVVPATSSCGSNTTKGHRCLPIISGGAAGARALHIADYGITVGGAATLFAISASGIPEAVAAHPPRKVVLFGGRIVARDGVVLPVPAPIG
jgi:hypothetical protein